jgi:hypothetical protein
MHIFQQDISEDMVSSNTPVFIENTKPLPVSNIPEIVQSVPMATHPADTISQVHPDENTMAENISDNQSSTIDRDRDRDMDINDINENITITSSSDNDLPELPELFKE